MSPITLVDFFFSGFISVCPSGFVDKENIVDLYDMPKKKAKIFINQIFKLFDKDGSGDISFRVSVTFFFNWFIFS